VPAWAGDGQAADVGGPRLVRDVCARGVVDAAQLVHARDEGAEEAGVDEADEEGVGRGAVVGEEGEDAPGQGEDGGDEEDEDRGRGQGVGGDVLVDKVGQHAHRGNL
jgi:hypothetical protein